MTDATSQATHPVSDRCRSPMVDQPADPVPSPVLRRDGRTSPEGCGCADCRTIVTYQIGVALRLLGTLPVEVRAEVWARALASVPPELRGMVGA